MNSEQKIDVNFFPSTLEYLHIGCNFNQVLEQGMLPPKLTTLELSSNSLFQEIKGDILPRTLTELKLTKSCHFNLNLHNSPLNLKLYIQKSYKGLLTAPNYVKVLTRY
jgi:hypothetical protein